MAQVGLQRCLLSTRQLPVGTGSGQLVLLPWPMQEVLGGSAVGTLVQLSHNTSAPQDCPTPLVSPQEPLSLCHFCKTEPLPSFSAQGLPTVGFCYLQADVAQVREEQLP